MVNQENNQSIPLIEEYKELQFDIIRQTDIKHKPNIEVRASLS